MDKRLEEQLERVRQLSERVTRLREEVMRNQERIAHDRENLGGTPLSRVRDFRYWTAEPHPDDARAVHRADDSSRQQDGRRSAQKPRRRR